MSDDATREMLGQARFELRATADSHFAWVRTRLALERTLMSWVRTATALIGFGFTIVQFFEHLSTMAGVLPAERPEAPRYLGLALIAAGVVSLLMSAWQCRWTVNYMWSPQFRAVAGLREGGMHTSLYFVIIALTFIGLFAFGAVWLRVV